MDFTTLAAKAYKRSQKSLIQKIKQLAHMGDEQLANQRGVISEAASQAISQDVIDKLQCQESDQLVEIGCGTGLLANALGGKIRLYAGCDLVFDLLQMAKKHNVSPHTYFLQADGQHLPFKDASIDRILFYGVILYLPPVILKLILKECKRILKPGGFMLLGDIPDPKYILDYLKINFSSSYNIPGLHYLLYPPFRLKRFISKYLSRPGVWYKPAEIINILEKEGLKGFVVPQGRNCPFGYYRYDCLVSLPGD